MDYDINYLRQKLVAKSSRVDLRYKYYEMKSHTYDFNIATPPNLKWFVPTLGWCAKSVDSLTTRLKIRGFKDDNYNMESLYRTNSMDILMRSAIQEALIASCSFIYVYLDDNSEVRMQVLDGMSATGVLDPITMMLKCGYAVLDRDDRGFPILEAFFLPGQTLYYQQNKVVRIVPTDIKYPTLVPIIYRPDTKRPFGHSRITRACMSLQDSAIRTMKRLEIAGEFNSVPQKYVTGLSPDAEPMDKWKATVSTLLAFTKDEDGDHPVAGQFNAMTTAPFTEAIKTFAEAFCGETGLTLDDLGFMQSNPASADAIKSGHETLRLTARDAQDTFGIGFINAGIVGCCLRDGVDYNRNSFYETTVKWMPVFEPDGTSMAGIGDAAIKINQAVPGYFNTETLSELIGIDGGEAEDASGLLDTSNFNFE